MKALPTDLVRQHFKTYVDANTGRPMMGDYVVFVAVPVGVGVACGATGVKLPTGASAGLLTVSGLLSAFLFGVMLQVSDRAMNWADTSPQPSFAVTKHARFLGQIAANAGYASLISILACGTFVVASVTSRDVLVAFSAAGLALIAHLGLVLSMVMVRVFALTRERLIRVETGDTGDNVTHLQQKRNAS
jgi:hypothetical protein